MLNRLFFYISFTLYSFCLEAQVGGRNTFEFMRIPQHASVASLGGVNITTGLEDVNMFLQNPALLNDKVAKHASFSHHFWFADIGQSTLTYAHPFKRFNGNLGFGLQVVNYGKLKETDASGVVLGEFSASDFALQTTYSLQQEHFRFGTTLRFLGSQIAGYSAYSLVMDLGGIFIHPETDFRIGLVVKNLGFPIKKFSPQSQVHLPFDVQLGTSFKPQYMPFRFSVSLQHLYQFDIVYLDPLLSTTLDANGNPIVEQKKFMDKLFRHFVLGGEMLLSDNFNIRLGYNHLINKEMKVRDLGNLRGISLGFMLKVKAFAFSYALGTYHVGATRHLITLESDFNRILKKKKVIE
jgi:hypothetical protein